MKGNLVFVNIFAINTNVLITTKLKYQKSKIKQLIYRYFQITLNIYFEAILFELLFNI